MHLAMRRNVFVEQVANFVQRPAKLQACLRAQLAGIAWSQRLAQLPDTRKISLHGIGGNLIVRNRIEGQARHETGNDTADHRCADLDS